MILCDEDISLVPLEEKYIELIRNFRNSDFVRNNFIYRKLITEEEQQKWFKEKVCTGKIVAFVVFYSSKPVGLVYIQNFCNESKMAESGLFFSEYMPKGKGIGTKAYKLLIQYADEVLKLHKLKAQVLESNAASQRIHEKLGFVREGVLVDELLINSNYETLYLYGKILSH